MNSEILAVAEEAGISGGIGDLFEATTQAIEHLYYLAQANALEEAADSNDMDSYHSFHLREMAYRKRKQGEA